MKILVVGAGGYLGGRISQHLAEKGNSVTALVYPRPKDSGAWEKRMERVVEGDATKEEVLLSALQDKPDCIIFLISLDHKESGRDLSRTLDINTGIFWKLLDIYAKRGGGRVIYLSTQQVYGKHDAGGVINEATPLLPVNAYGLTHTYCEALCSFYTREKGLECISIRLSNSFGAPVFAECNCWWLAINDFCRMAFKDKAVRLLSDGTPQRDFLPLDDVCRAVEMLVSTPSASLKHSVYNLGGGKTYTILEAAHRVTAVCTEWYGKDIPVLLPGDKVSSGVDVHRDVPRFSYDIRRIRELGFMPSADLRPGIEEVLDFLGKS